MLGGFFNEGTQVIVRGTPCIRKGMICSNQVRVRLEALPREGMDVYPYQLHFYGGDWAAIVNGTSQLVSEILYHVLINGKEELVSQKNVEEF